MTNGDDLYYMSNGLKAYIVNESYKELHINIYYMVLIEDILC
jgi:hypothetical protein